MVAIVIALLIAFAAGYLLGVRNYGVDLPDNGGRIGAVRGQLDAAGGHNLAAQGRTDLLEAERGRSAESVDRSRQFLGNNEAEL